MYLRRSSGWNWEGSYCREESFESTLGIGEGMVVPIARGIASQRRSVGSSSIAKQSSERNAQTRHFESHSEIDFQKDLLLSCSERTHFRAEPWSVRRFLIICQTRTWMLRNSEHENQAHHDICAWLR